MTIPTAIHLIGGLTAALCVGAVPLWILGVPGTDGDYAKGWGMGLQVLWMYPTAFLVNFVVFFLARKLAGDGGHHWLFLSASVTVVLLVASAMRLYKAFKIMP